VTPPSPNPPRAALHSVGCKLNQFEGQVWAQELRRRGYEIVDFDSPAEVYILNTCTVTSRSDRECRRLARGARRQNPTGLIVLTGCYVEVAGEALAARELADLLLGREEKPDLVRRVEEALGRATPGARRSPASSRGQEGTEIEPLLVEFTGHTRAFLKVQEGCAGSCAFCVIARARGQETSVPSEQVLAQARLLARRHPELVLVGTHLGRYDRDLPGEPDLAGLVERVCALPEVGRVRLSSLEPMEVSAELREQVAGGGHALPPDPSRPAQGKLCRHLHLPLQSGADSVLRRMGRPYDTAAYAELVADLRRRQPGLGLGADVMVGFPGETEADFAATVEFLEALSLSYLHVFTYSPRPGTPAAEMPEQVRGQVKQERNHVLRALSERKREAFARSQVGQRLELVVERRGERGEIYGLSDNYLEVELPTPTPALGSLVAVEIVAACGASLRAEKFSAPE
jgi:threonylcarbamoyladenosine tRNA methylthiotransferase MtaB